MLVQMSFFTAYFVGSLIYFLISSKRGDPIEKIGYKNGILIGLAVSALGCALFYPAAELKEYWFFLMALFILALGLTMLQIASNPYVARLGSPETASSRLNLSQGFNSLGTTLAPIVGGYFVFHYFASWGEPLLNKLGEPITTDTGMSMSVLSIQLPYLLFALTFLLLAVMVFFAKLPVLTNNKHIQTGAGALKYRHLSLGMVAIFMYVGAEVAIGSLLINYVYELIGIPEVEATKFLAFYWGGLMIGRFMGVVSFKAEGSALSKILGMMAVATVSFLVIYFAVLINSGFSFSFMTIAPFILFIALNVVAFRIGRSNPARTMSVFSIMVILLLALTMLTDGYVAMWCVLSIGLFNSIMWSNIFTLAIKDLGKYTSQGSSLLVMSILGGALIPIVQAALADNMGGYHYSFFVPMLCYVYLAYYGIQGYKVRKWGEKAVAG